MVAAESSLHPLFVGNFERLGVLPPAGYGCRPFDTGRRGFLISEAAAAVLIEGWEPGQQAAANGEQRETLRRPVRIDRCAFAGDATHLTTPDPNSEALRRLLKDVLAGRPVDLIHAHGTGTTLNDEMELRVIESVCGERPASGGDPPSLYSHKGALGHSLARRACCRSY